MDLMEEFYKKFDAHGEPMIIPSSGECIGYTYPELTEPQQLEICKCLPFGKDFTISGHPCYSMEIFDGTVHMTVWDMDFDKCLVKMCMDYYPQMKDFERKTIKSILENRRV